MFDNFPDPKTQIWVVHGSSNFSEHCAQNLEGLGLTPHPVSLEEVGEKLHPHLYPKQWVVVDGEALAARRHDLLDALKVVLLEARVLLWVRESLPSEWIPNGWIVVEIPHACEDVAAILKQHFHVGEVELG